MGIFDIFKKKKTKTDNNQIKGIRFLFDYCSNNIFFYDVEGRMMFWGDSLIPPEWQTDKKFMELNDKLCKEYDSLFNPTATKVDYIGFKDEKQKENFKKLVDEFVKYVEEKNNGKYEIANDYDVESL